MAPAARAEGGSLGEFLRQSATPTGRQSYLARVRLAAPVRAVLGKLPVIGKRITDRQMVSVSNANLEQYVAATERGYLEVVVPKGKGHVFFRYGREVFDFYPGGFRVGPVRPIGSERYGMLVPLTAEQETRLQGYLGRLKQTNGAELGEYDFHGGKGFHCVTWMMRLAFDPQQGDLVSALGGKHRDGSSMPSFSRFMLKAARPVDAVVLYSAEGKSARELSRAELDLMSLRDIGRAFRAEQRAAAGN